MKKICIITPGILASNPRVVKEAEVLSEAGYQVHLIYTRHVNYLISDDEEILREHPEWTFDYLDWAGPDYPSRKLKFFSGIKKKVSTCTIRAGMYPERSAGILLNRFYSWQLKKAIAQKADLYIAHYPDSIAVAAQAAKTNKSHFAFDAEDYHRGEDLPKWLIKIITLVENRLLPKARFISAASPLIALEYQKHYSETKVFTLENTFPKKRQPAFIKLSAEPFKFFWFSQTIGQKRGLEQFISILGECKRTDLQLTLLGNCNNSYQDILIKLWTSKNLNPESLIILPTVPEKQIFLLASRHHFGLGLEIPYSKNRNICLTNKIFTYILSGNFLILSETEAQQKFNSEYPGTGTMVDLYNPKKAAKVLLELLGDPELEQKRSQNYHLGKNSLNFDRQKSILLSHVTQVWN